MSKHQHKVTKFVIGQAIGGACSIEDEQCTRNSIFNVSALHSSLFCLKKVLQLLSNATSLHQKDQISNTSSLTQDKPHYGNHDFPTWPIVFTLYSSLINNVIFVLMEITPLQTPLPKREQHILQGKVSLVLEIPLILSFLTKNA